MKHVPDTPLTPEERKKVFYYLAERYFTYGERDALEALVGVLYDEHHTKIMYCYLKQHDRSMSTTMFHSVRQRVMVEFLKYGQKENSKVPEDPFGAILLHGKNRLIDIRRKRSRTQNQISTGVSEEVLQVPDARPSVTQRVSIVEFDEALKTSLFELSETDQHIISLHLDGASIKEMAEAIGDSSNTAKQQLKNARNRLRKVLASKHPDLSEILPKSSNSDVTRTQVLAVMRKWPPAVAEAARLLHLDNPPLSQAELEKRLGKKTAGYRLDSAYRRLTRKFKIPFPEAFEVLADE